MSAESNPVRELEMLRDLVVSSIDVVKGAVLEHQDPPLTLHAVDEHPIHRRDERNVLYALKSIASAGQMLRALCGPNTYLNDFTYGCHDQTSLLVACQADIPNYLVEGPCHIDELAAKTGLNAGVLARFLRNLCNSHIFQEVAPNTFANNALSVRYRSEALRAIVGHWYVLVIPQFRVPVADSFPSIDGCRPASCKVWDAMTSPEFKNATEPTKAPFNIAYDTPLDYFKYTTTVRPEMAKRTQKAMGGKAFNLGEYLSRKSWPPRF